MADVAAGRRLILLEARPARGALGPKRRRKGRSLLQALGALRRLEGGRAAVGAHVAATGKRVRQLGGWAAALIAALLAHAVQCDEAPESAHLPNTFLAHLTRVQAVWVRML